MRANYKCFLTAIILLPILILNLGCQQQKNDNKIEALIDAKDNTSTEKTVSKNIYPDTTGESLWSYVNAANYKSWDLWPGKKPFFKGESPHGKLLTVYVDTLVYDALENGADNMPARSIIVKENYDLNKKLKTHTIMYKVPGYSPEHHDWFWGWYAPDGKIIGAGKVKACYQCHDVAGQYDDLWILRDQNYLKENK